MENMKNLLITLLIVFSISFSTQDIIAQVQKDTVNIRNENKANETLEKRKIFSIGIGLNLGFFYSAAINNYIKNDLSSYNISSGTTDMFLGFTPAISLSLMPIKYLNIQILGEIRWSPKISVKADYHFLRYTTGLMIHGYFPFGALEKFGILIGAGGLYHHYNFEEYKTDSFGIRGQIGLRFNFSKIAIDVLASYDFAPADAVKGTLKMNLGDNGGNIGFLVHFKII